MRVFPGSTGDPAAFTAIADVVRKKFKLAQMVMVGDRGMITSARIQALNQQEDGTPQPDPYQWITALRAPAIRKLMADDGPLQLSLSGQQDLAEITSPDFPGERLIACRNPVLAVTNGTLIRISYFWADYADVGISGIMRTCRLCRPESRSSWPEPGNAAPMSA